VPADQRGRKRPNGSSEEGIASDPSGLPAVVPELREATSVVVEDQSSVVHAQDTAEFMGVDSVASAVQRRMPQGQSLLASSGRPEASSAGGWRRTPACEITRLRRAGALWAPVSGTADKFIA
jgi:hypothetical protein